MFFGCRNRISDFIYQDEIEEQKSNKSLSDCFIAFSREQANKLYVQDLIKERKNQIIDLLNSKKGYFYICGNSKMGQEVQAILKDFLGEQGFKDLEKEKRLIKELWG